MIYSAGAASTFSNKQEDASLQCMFDSNEAPAARAQHCQEGCTDVCQILRARPENELMAQPVNGRTDAGAPWRSLWCAWMQAKHRDTCNSNAQELRQLKQDLHTAMDMLRTHRQGINASLDATLAHVRAVHSELVEV